MGGSSSKDGHKGSNKQDEFMAKFNSRIEQLIAEDKRKENESRAVREARDERIKALMRDVLEEEKKKSMDRSSKENADHTAMLRDLFQSLAGSRGAGPDKLADFIQTQLAEMQSSQEVKITVEKKPTGHYTVVQKKPTGTSTTHSHMHTSNQKPRVEALSATKASLLSEFNPLCQNNGQPVQEKVKPPPPPSFINNKPMGEAAQDNYFQADYSRVPPPPLYQDWKNKTPPFKPNDHGPSAPKNEDEELFKRSNISPGQHNFKKPPSLFNVTKQNNSTLSKGGSAVAVNQPSNNLYPDLSGVNAGPFNPNKNVTSENKHLQNKLSLLGTPPPQYCDTDYDNGPFLDKGPRFHSSNFKTKEGASAMVSDKRFSGPNSENFHANRNQRGGFHRGRGGPRGQGQGSYDPQNQFGASGGGQQQQQQQREGALFPTANEGSFRGPNSAHHSAPNYQRGGRGNHHRQGDMNWTSKEGQQQLHGPDWKENNPRGRRGHNHQRSRSKPRFHKSLEAMNDLSASTEIRPGNHYQKGPRRGRGAYPRPGPRPGAYTRNDKPTAQEGAWSVDNQDNVEDSDRESVLSVDSNISTRTNPKMECEDFSSDVGSTTSKKKRNNKKKQNKMATNKDVALTQEGIRAGEKDISSLAAGQQGESAPVQLFLGGLDNDALTGHDPSTSLAHSVVVIVKLEKGVESFHPATVGDLLKLKQTYPNAEVVVVG